MYDAYDRYVWYVRSAERGVSSFLEPDVPVVPDVPDVTVSTSNRAVLAPSCPRGSL